MHSSATTDLLEDLENGKLDITLTTEAAPAANMMLADQLVWAGMRGGRAFRQSPLPMALGSDRCMFRSYALQALADRGVEWKLTCHVGSNEPIIALLEADLGVAPFLSHTVPADLEIIAEASGLPKLPMFYVNMYLKQGQNNPAVLELAQHIRNGFAGRYKTAA